MKQLKYSMVPEHGLQVEETLMAGDRQGGEHLSRYWWAWTVRKAFKARKILDLGCGCGYGTRILAEDHEDLDEIIGIDAHTEGINLGRREYGGYPKIHFNELSLDNPWPTATGAYDMAVCFDVLEVIRHRDLFLDQLTQSLADNGVALFSAGLWRLEPNPDPEDAYFRYSGKLLVSTLSRYFNIVTPFTSAVSEEQDVFAYIHELNKTLREAVRAGEPLQVGQDLVYCASPIRK